MALNSQPAEVVNATGGAADGTQTINQSASFYRHQFGINIAGSATVAIQWRRAAGTTAHELTSKTASTTVHLTGYYPVLEVVVSGTSGALVVDVVQGDESE